MAYHNKKNTRNLMEDMRRIIHEMENLKPEPEECNISCPPFGCPEESSSGQCCNSKACDSVKARKMLNSSSILAPQKPQNSSESLSHQNKNSSCISACQVPLTNQRCLQTKSQFLPNTQSLVQINYPPIHGLNGFHAQDRQQYYSKSTPSNHLHQQQMFQQFHYSNYTNLPEQSHNFSSLPLQQQSCSEPSSCLVSIPPFR